MSTITKPITTTREYTPQDEEPVLELLKEALGETSIRRRTSESWRWKHVDNAFGPSYARVACNEEGDVIGLRTLMQWHFHMGNRPLRAVQAVDTATHPKYRRMGIFSTLTSEVVEDVERDGVDLIFNTPNLMARPGYLKMGWQMVGTIQPLILILNPFRVFRTLCMKGMRHHKVEPPSQQEFFKRSLPKASVLLDYQEAMEELFANDRRLNESDSIATTLSIEYLRWRYTAHPDIPYYTLFEGTGSHLRACAIIRTGTRFGLKEVLLSELWLAEPDEKLSRGILNRVKSAVDGDYIIAYAQEGTFQRHALKKCGFRPLPQMTMNERVEKFLFGLQKPRRLTTRPLVNDLTVDPLVLKNWVLSLGDLEIF